MKLTKYNHACVILEKNNQLLIIDPGSFTALPEDLLSTCAIVITHIHADHLSKDNVQKILAINPEAIILAPKQVADTLTEFHNVQVVTANQQITVGPFKLQFFGVNHAVIHDSLPLFDNVGVLVDDKIYYPGDSFVLPGDKKPNLLLAPVNAPWMKISEAMDFITAAQAGTVIPTHDALLSDLGVQFNDNWLKHATESYGGTFKRLQPSESTSL